MKKKPDGYWKDIENVKREIKVVMEEHDFKSIPTQKEFFNLGYINLVSRISEFHGINNVRIIMGESIIQKPNGYWKDKKNVLNEINKINKKYNFDGLQSSSKLKNLGYYSLVHAITKYHGGFPHQRELLGEKQKRIADGLWNSLEYTINVAKYVMIKNKLKMLPSESELRKLKCSSLAMAIYKHHGGMKKFRERLGQEQLINQQGIWKNLDFTIQEAKRVMTKHNFTILPSQNKLGKLRYSSLGSAIYKYHGGFSQFRVIMGEKIIRNKYGIWKDQEYTINIAKEVLKKLNVITLPSYIPLSKMGYVGLSNAINRYYGGFPAFRSLLNKELGIESEKERLENVIQEYVNEEKA